MNQKKSGDKQLAVSATSLAEDKKVAKDTAAAEFKEEPKQAKRTVKRTSTTAKTMRTRKTTDTKPVEKTEDTKPAEKAAVAKRAEKTADTKPAEKKPRAKRAAAKTDVAETPKVRKKPGRKAKKDEVVTIETICSKLEKKIGNKTSIKDKIAVDIEVWGFEDGSKSKMYIELNDGKITVAPYTYEEKNFRVSLKFENAVAFVDGKITLKELIASENFYAEGNISDAVKLASVF